MIKLTCGGQFNEYDLIKEIRLAGRNDIVQGQVAAKMTEHPKPSSLDYWLRSHSKQKNTKAANNKVISALISTGMFEQVDDVACPDSGRKCKGIRLVERNLSA